MKFLPLLTLLLHLAKSQVPTSFKECVLELGSTRTFHSAVEYQDTKFSFNPHHGTYQGNVVQFTSLGASILPKNFFVSFDSDYIIVMHLESQGVSVIQDGAFLGLFCLQDLNLANNSISTLSEGSFEGLQNLATLNLSFNNLVNVPDNGLAFVTLQDLKLLDLSHNRIYSLEKLSFMTMTKLEVLDLSFNRLHLIADGVFDYLEGLKTLYLNDNQLVEVSADRWKGLSKLETLSFAGNYLRAFDPAAGFSFAGLKHLNLSRNSLSGFNAVAAKLRLPKLAVLDLRDNSWYCYELELIKHQLYDSGVVLSEPLNCSDVSTTSLRPSPTTRPPVDIRSLKDAATPTESPMEREIEAIEMRVRHLEKRADHGENMTIFLFVVLALFFSAQVAVRLGVCGFVYDRLAVWYLRFRYTEQQNETLLLARH